MKVATTAIISLFAAIGFANAYHPSEPLDNAWIHSGCNIEDGYHPQYYTDADCNDLYGITTGCSNGDGWYCNDHVDVTGMNSDISEIREGCAADGLGVHYLDSGRFGERWYCKDDGPSNDYGGYDANAYIHGGCGPPFFPVYYTDAECNDLWNTKSHRAFATGNPYSNPCGTGISYDVWGRERKTP